MPLGFTASIGVQVTKKSGPTSENNKFFYPGRTSAGARQAVFDTDQESPIPGAGYVGRDFQAVVFSKLPPLDFLNYQSALPNCTSLRSVHRWPGCSAR
jgi:hypothetical protein